MRKETGIVLEIENGRAIVVTSDGGFKRVRVARDTPVGAEVPIRPIPTRLLLSTRALGAVAAVLLLVLVGVIVPRGMVLSSPAAYVSLDMEPSVELGIDGDGNVVKVNPLDERAVKVVSGLDLRGRSLKEAIEAFALKALELGYVGDEDGCVILSGISRGKVMKRPLDDIVKEAHSRLFEIMSQRQVGRRIDSFIGAESLRKEAKSAGLSVGKYVVYEEARKLGAPVDPGEMRELGIERALKEAGVDPEKIFRTIRNREEFRIGSTIKRESSGKPFDADKGFPADERGFPNNRGPGDGDAGEHRKVPTQTPKPGRPSDSVKGTDSSPRPFEIRSGGFGEEKGNSGIREENDTKRSGDARGRGKGNTSQDDEGRETRQRPQGDEG